MQDIKNKIILSIDAINDYISIAIADNNKIISYKQVFIQNIQSDFLIKLIDDIIYDNNFTYYDLSYILINDGACSITAKQILYSFIKIINLTICTKIIRYNNLYLLSYLELLNIDNINFNKIMILLKFNGNNYFIEEFKIKDKNLIGNNFTIEDANHRIINITNINNFIDNQKEIYCFLYNKKNLINKYITSIMIIRLFLTIGTEKT